MALRQPARCSSIMATASYGGTTISLGASPHNTSLYVFCKDHKHAQILINAASKRIAKNVFVLEILIEALQGSPGISDRLPCGVIID